MIMSLQYCFKIEWPDKHAPNGGSTVELGFDSAAMAKEWHGLISAQIHALSPPAVPKTNSALSLAPSSGEGSMDATPYSMSPEPSVPVSKLYNINKHRVMGTQGNHQPRPCAMCWESSGQSRLPCDIWGLNQVGLWTHFCYAVLGFLEHLGVTT